MKKILVLILSVVLSVVSLAGCGSGSSNTTGKETDTQEAATVAEDNLSLAEQAIAERKESGNYPTIVMAFLNWTGAPSGTERIQNLISAYTEEKLGIHVRLEILDSSSYSQQMTLMLASGEQVDLFNAVYVGYSSSVNKGYCLDMEENDLIQTYGQGILDTMNDVYVNACRINGILYGVPQQRDMAIGMGGYVIAAEYLDGIGYDYASMYTEGSEFIQTTPEDIEEIFEKLHETYPNIYVFAPQESFVRNSVVYDDIGGDVFGVLMDMNKLEVSNLYSSEAFKALCEKAYEWNQAGYISRDTLTDNTTGAAQVKAGTAMAYMSALKPGIAAQEAGIVGRDIVVFQTSENIMRSGAVASMPWCISSQSENQTAAMQFLELCYTDPYLSNLLCWGEEGVEYVKTEDGHITFADGVDAQSTEWYNNVNWEMPNQFIAEIWEGNDLAIWDKMEKFNNEANVTKALGFTFDNSSVTSEYSALKNVYDEYIYQLIYGFTNPETGIPEMINKLEVAGLQKYMDAKQTALGEWEVSNKISE